MHKILYHNCLAFLYFSLAAWLGTTLIAISNTLPMPSLLWLVLFCFSVQFPSRIYIIPALLAGFFQDKLLAAPLGFYTFSHTSAYILACAWHQKESIQQHTFFLFLSFYAFSICELILRLGVFFVFEHTFSLRLTMEIFFIMVPLGLIFLFVLIKVLLLLQQPMWSSFEG